MRYFSISCCKYHFKSTTNLKNSLVRQKNIHTITPNITTYINLFSAEQSALDQNRILSAFILSDSFRCLSLLSLATSDRR